MAFDADGELVRTAEYTASLKGVRVGSRVTALRRMTKVDAGALGAVLGFTHSAGKVQWDAGAVSTCSAASLQLHEEPPSEERE